MKKLFAFLFALLLILSLAGCTAIENWRIEREKERTYAAAEELYAAGDYLAAVELYQDLTWWSDPHKDSFEKENLCYMHLGNAEKVAGNFEAAIEQYQNIDLDWTWEELDRSTLINVCKHELCKQDIPKLLKPEFMYDSFWGLQTLECKSIEIVDSKHIELTFCSDEFETWSDHDKIGAMWGARWCVNSTVPEKYGSFFTSTSIQTKEHTYTASLLSGKEDVLMQDGKEIYREESRAIVDAPVSSGGSGGCSLCNGTGSVKYYSSGSDLESILQGYDPYTFGTCSRCGGTGKE